MTGKDILIVEDENIVALDMRMRLETMGYRVLDVVDTGSLALERALASSPDLVLMDIKLKGGQDGVEAARALRERAEVPVIFVTAFTDEKTLERAKKTSPYGYIVKPFHERELRIAIELALYKHEYERSIKSAKELAEAANRLKGEFLANVSHELKTPLNSMIGFTELSIEKAVDDEQREYLAMSLAAARTLQTLIDSILEFTRMEAGKLSAVASPFSLDSVLADCVDALAMGAYAKGLDASFRRSPEVPDALEGDHFLLKQALLNLIDNAVKFTASGRVGLRVSTAPESGGTEGGLAVEFEVSDTGIGMPSDKIESAFDRFTQLDPTKTRKAGGTGLGLAIVKKAVELLEGSVAVESEEGRGTIVRLLVPFAFSAEARPRERSPLAGESVAVAGFDDSGYADAAMALEGLGARAARAASLAEAAGAARWTLAEEGAAAVASEGEIAALLPRLIVATRIGGVARRRLERTRGCAFTPLPLRDYKIAEAARALATDSIEPTFSEASEKGGGLAPALGPNREPEVSGQQKALLDRLAGVLERASTQRSFAAAERESKTLKDAFAESGDRDGARIAFAALLLARKGDAEGLLEVASRARLASRYREAGLKEGR
jgi:signal transduction histidine kinase